MEWLTNFPLPLFTLKNKLSICLFICPSRFLQLPFRSCVGWVFSPSLPCCTASGSQPDDMAESPLLSLEHLAAGDFHTDEYLHSASPSLFFPSCFVHPLLFLHSLPLPLFSSSYFVSPLFSSLIPFITSCPFPPFPLIQMPFVPRLCFCWRLVNSLLSYRQLYYFYFLFFLFFLSEGGLFGLNQRWCLRTWACA